MGGVSGALGLLCSLFFGFLGGSHLSAWGVIVQKMSMRALRVFLLDIISVGARVKTYIHLANRSPCLVSS